MKKNLNKKQVMNYGISVLFRAIPLLMALFCFGYGFFVFNYGVDSSRFVAGPVVFSLGFICIALFATAATIIRQIIHTYNNVARFALPILGYLSATITFLAGFILLMSYRRQQTLSRPCHLRVGIITACVATTATASTRFTLIQMNAKSDDPRIPDKAFNFWQGVFLILVASFISIVAWIWAYRLLAHSDEHSQYFVAGHVMAGPSMYLQQLNRFSRHDRPTNKKHIFPIGKKAMAPFCHPDGIYQSDMGPLRIRR